ncbi:aldehyde dehydrogenase family protein [Mycobacterium sp. CVI_P3]|uniref:Aldehyde dehydrogenase family protein n=1 Tax=Mycobacterium pinniadriaticum TaxID=2994102 RepID=A0ABT3SDE3_9MYCO|nr:aldehyde dehydrogenase family protein [Mycobacterium pinniadriaticum]MCX2931262.1 aldehyde dehydrogenase family protein [Mycobacterium pinniadriaticum]MCX2937514.1 aldehyde dehydrogenase family protein [Mycobacterium pinniadriaticum]
MIDLPGLVPGGEYRSRRREVVTDAAGTPMAELSIAPPLYIARAMAAQRRTRPLPVDQRRAALNKAGAVFATSEAAGLDFESYVRAASRVSGLPIAVTRRQAREVSEAVIAAFDSAQPARPVAAALDWQTARSGQATAIWSRRGELFGVHASGNAPGVHGLWPQALALGYRVAIRPSRREPFTAHRLVAALREAGFRDDDVAYLPTDHAGADEIVASADLALVYGGSDVVAKYSGDPTVFVNGPGRTKILLTAEQDWRDHLDVIVDSIARLGGMACVNATAVLVEGDAAPLAAAIAERLRGIEALPPEDERAILPTQPIESARAVAGFVAARAAGTTALLGADQVVADLGDGRAALRPAVHVLTGPDSEKLNTELAFPCVWIAPWERTNGIGPLRDSLVVTVFTEDDALVGDLLDEPSIANVYRGPVPTYYTAAGLPHDGFLADFLMRTKGFVRLDG